MMARFKDDGRNRVVSVAYDDPDEADRDDARIALHNLVRSGTPSRISKAFMFYGSPVVRDFTNGAALVALTKGGKPVKNP